MPRPSLVLSALTLAVWSVPISTSAAEQTPAPATTSKYQTACLPETDPSSPRHT